jgi:hypothetical protein
VRHKHYCPTVTFSSAHMFAFRSFVEEKQLRPNHTNERHGLTLPAWYGEADPLSHVGPTAPGPGPVLAVALLVNVGGLPWPIDLPLPYRPASVVTVLGTAPSESEPGGAAGRVLAPPFRGAGSSFSVGQPAKGVGRPECPKGDWSRPRVSRPHAGMGRQCTGLVLGTRDGRDKNAANVVPRHTSQPRATTEQLLAHTKAPIGDWGSLLFVSGIDCGSLARAFVRAAASRQPHWLGPIASKATGW